MITALAQISSVGINTNEVNHLELFKMLSNDYTDVNSLVSLNIDFKDTIHVKDQLGLDTLSSLIRELNKANHKNILISFSPKKYYCNDEMISLTEMDSLNICFDGNSCTFIGNGKDTEIMPNPNYTYFNLNKHINLWSKVCQSDEPIGQVDSITYFMKINPQLSAQVGDYIQISQWFRSAVYQITDISNGLVKFTQAEVRYGGNVKGWDVKADVTYGHVMPRYRIFSANPNIVTFESSAS